MADIQVALLRGINVGPNKRVAMADLRALVEGLGAESVRTILNSGNVVFSAGAVKPGEAASRIEKGLESTLGVSARVVVISARELAEVVDANPLVKIADNSSRLLVGILADPADKEKLADIAGQDWGKERIALVAARGKQTGAARAVYMWMPKGVIESKLNQAVGKVLGDAVTARNWATMLKLKEMTEESAG
jgi:uncharacterized protein (DUF1697 family)